MQLFKNISIKLPGWLRAAPIHSAHAPSSTPLQFHHRKFLGRPKSNDFFTRFPGTVQFLGQDFKQAAGWLEVLGMDQPLAGHCPGGVTGRWREMILGPADCS